MYRKLFLLSCVLVLSLAVTVRAEDLEPPWFAGADGSGSTIWEFDIDPVIGEVLTNPDGEGPTAYCYWPELDGYEFSVWPSYGTVLWDEGGQMLTVDDDETGFYMSVPDGEGTYLTLYAQITWSGGDNWPMLEGWDTPSREGTYLFGMDGDELDHWGDPVEIEPGVFHQTFYHTFDWLEPGEIPPYVNLLIWWEGCEVYEVILDAIVHPDLVAPDGPGTRCGGWQMQVSNASPADGEAHVDPSTDLSFQAPEDALCLFVDDPNDPNDAPPDPNFAGPFEYDVYFGTEPNVLTMTQLADGFTPTNCNDVMVFDPCAGGDLALATKYYWRVDINDANGAGDPCFYEGPYFSFSTLGLADIIAPADGAGGVPVYDTNLIWAGDSFAASFDVYFSTDYNAVDNGTASMGNQGPNTYSLPDLMLDTDYFWRIDEVNGIALKGDIWSFTTDISTEIDSMDSYSSTNEIYDTWLDYFVLSRSHAEILRETNPPNIQDGNSMKFVYDNAGKEAGAWRGSWTEAEVANLPIGSNWTAVGGKALQIWFRGTLGNSVTSNDKMYIALDDGTTVAAVLYPDINDVNVPLWQEWNIDLEDFNSQGVNLSSISKIHIGFAGTLFTGQSADGGQGTVYFDNFRLFATRCVQAEAPGDATGDCTVNTEDLQELQWGWLVRDYEVPPEEPNRNGLLVEYLFDSDYSDTSGAPTYNGIPGAFASISSGTLSLTGGIGNENIVEIPFGAANPFQGSSDYTISLWFKSAAAEGSTLFSSSDVDANNLEDPNHQATHPLSVYYFLEDATLDFLGVTHDNWWAGAAGADLEEAGLVNEWVHVAFTYDADGGICPDDADPNMCTPGEPTGYAFGYINGNPGWEGQYDPNIPEIDDDSVWIGDIASQAAKDDLGLVPFSGNIDDFRIYDSNLPHSNIMWLAGKAEPTYFPLDEPSNLYPKVGSYGYDPNNQDIVDFRDFTVIADHWLEGPTLWP